MKPEDYSRRQVELAGWPITVESYKLGEVYHCTIANVDPGARFARADGATKDEAEQRALAKAERYLAQTRRFPTTDPNV
jgi:acetamidase/formamidase